MPILIHDMLMLPSRTKGLSILGAAGGPNTEKEMGTTRVVLRKVMVSSVEKDSPGASAPAVALQVKVKFWELIDVEVQLEGDTVAQLKPVVRLTVRAVVMERKEKDEVATALVRVFKVKGFGPI